MVDSVDTRGITLNKQYNIIEKYMKFFIMVFVFFLFTA